MLLQSGYFDNAGPMAAAKEEPEPLAVISSCLHSDPRLNEEAAVALDQMVKAAYRSMVSQ